MYNQTMRVRTAVKVLPFVIFMWMTTAAMAFAQVDITDKFTDENFRNYVASTFGDGLFPIKESEIEIVSTLDVYDKGIKSLDGIEYFRDLQSLECSYNQLTELNVSQNKELKKIVCDNNQLTKLNVSGLKNLTLIRCSNNQLAELDVSDNNKLEDLFCNNNHLTELDVSQNPELTALECSNNQLTELDVSRHTYLKYLYCEYNLLVVKKLNITETPALVELNYSNNYMPDREPEEGIVGFHQPSAILTGTPQRKAPSQPPLTGGTLPPLPGDDTYDFGTRGEWYDHLDKVPFEFKPLTGDYAAWLFKDIDNDPKTVSPFVLFGDIEENAAGDGFIVFVRVKPDLPLGVHTDTLLVYAAGGPLSKTPLVFTVQAAMPTPSMPRRIVIPYVEGAKTDPPVGVHYVSSGQDFVFTFTPTDTTLFYDAPIVRTGRLNQTGDDDVIVTPKADGTYTVRIRIVRQAITLTIEAPPPAPPAGMAAFEAPAIRSYGGQLYVSAATSGEARIYNPAGMLVKALSCASGETVRTPLPQGFYLVVADGKMNKVVVGK
jgi:hypothetical protein